MSDSTVVHFIESFPKLIGMNADELAELIEYLDHTKDLATDELRISCEREGHRWNNSDGEMVTIDPGGQEYRVMIHEPCDLGDRGEYATHITTPEYALKRKCLRCGKLETGKRQSKILKAQ